MILTIRTKDAKKPALNVYHLFRSFNFTGSDSNKTPDQERQI